MTPIGSHWSDALPDRAFRLVAWLQLTDLDEPDAALAIARLSRAELHDDDFGKAVADALDGWLKKFGLKLRH
jgi:hypothetical protein